MKKILGLLLLVVVPLTAQAQGKTGLYTMAPCDTVDAMFDLISKKYDEELLFTGTGMVFSPQQQPYTGGMFFFTNQEKGSYSVVKVFGDGMACMITNGRQLNHIADHNQEIKNEMGNSFLCNF